MVSLDLLFRIKVVFRALALGGALLAVLGSTVSADVQVSVDRRSHSVSGSTAVGLVRSMTSNPIQGDHGSAYASIHPNFILSLSTRQKGGVCRADVDIRLSFVLTLPRAESTSAMNSRTRAAWSRFASFAAAHEAHHQASYTTCAKSFVAAVQRQGVAQCVTLESSIRQKFGRMKSDCEATQRAFDRSQARVLQGLSLFAMARSHR